MNYLKEIEKEFKGKGFLEQRQIIKNYVVFDKVNNSGVYQIENFYIGKSKNILSRITYHIRELLSAENNKVVFNKKKLYLIKNVLENRKLNVKHLDKDVFKEKQYIEKLYPVLPLTNIEFVTDNMKIKKQIAISKFLKYKKITYISDKFTSKYNVVKVLFDNIILLEISKSYEVNKKRIKSYLQTKSPHKKKRDERILDKLLKKTKK